VAYRYWCNKLWNALRFALMYLPEGFTPSDPASLVVAALPAASRWVLSRLNGTVRGVVAAMEAYNFSDATQRLYAW
jgi:valyl-tRNA synthetase